jgi:hypothetical protein
MAKTRVIGLDRVKRRIKELSSGRNPPKCELGYGTNYAVYVHERTDLQHSAPTASKYLENPMNKHTAGYNSWIARKARELYERGVVKSIDEAVASAIYLKGLQIIGDSVRLVPVKTSRLKNTHFVTTPDGVAAKDAPVRPKESGDEGAPSLELQMGGQG